MIDNPCPLPAETQQHGLAPHGLAFPHLQTWPLFVSRKKHKSIVDTSGIEPDPSRTSIMLSERDNQLHHVPMHVVLVGILLV